MGVGRPCSVCQNQNRASIDKALVLGAASLTSIGTRFGVGAEALSRHRKRHIPAEILTAEAADSTSDDNVRREDLLAFVLGLRTKAATLLRQAELAGDTRGALLALREMARYCEIGGKFLQLEQMAGASPFGRPEVRDLGDQELMQIAARALPSPETAPDA